MRSFADSNGDGTGDIEGIMSRIPYLQSLGVEAIWVNPWYASPLNAGGYDVPTIGKSTLSSESVAIQSADPGSILNLYRRALRVLLASEEHREGVLSANTETWIR